MSSHLPDFVDPWRLSDLGKRFAGELELRRMARLGETLSNIEGSIAYDLEFGRDGKRRPRIKGRIRAVLALQCQRCLEQLDYPVETGFDLTVIETVEEAGRLSDEAEPVLATDGRIGLRELLEDELLLATPQVPRHDPAVCAVDVEAMESVPPASQSPQKATNEANPFAVLSGLKSTDKS